MRKLIVNNIMSLDGYYAAADGETSVLPMDEVFDSQNAERLRAADTLLLGRVTYDMFRAFWPKMAADPKASSTNREISRLMTAMDKVVVSDSKTSKQTEPWLNTRIIKRADAHRQLTELKRQTGKDILVCGSRTLWNGLLADGLVDELYLMIGQVVLGKGVPAFDVQPAVSLGLIDIRKWDGSDNVLVRYEVRRKEGRR